MARDQRGYGVLPNKTQSAAQEINMFVPGTGKLQSPDGVAQEDNRSAKHWADGFPANAAGAANLPEAGADGIGEGKRGK